MATQLEVIDFSDSGSRRTRPFLTPSSPIRLPSDPSVPRNTNRLENINLNKLSSSPEIAPNRFDKNGISIITPQPPLKINPLIKSNSETETVSPQSQSHNQNQNQSRAQSPTRLPKSTNFNRTTYTSCDESQPSSRRNSEDSPLSVLSTYFDSHNTSSNQKELNDLNEIQNQSQSQLNPSARSDSSSQQIASFVEAVKRNDMSTAHDIAQNSNSKKKILDGFHLVTGCTALTLSIVDGNESACKKLLDWGCDPNAKDAYQVPPLIHAVKGNREDIVKILLKKCAFINVVDSHSRTPLHYACEKNNRSIVKLLLVAGADILRRDVNGFSPLQLSDSAFIQALFKKHCERHGMDYADVASGVQTPRSPSVFSYRDIDSRSERSNTEARSEPRTDFSDSEYGGKKDDVNHSFESDSSTDTLMEKTEGSLLDMAILAAKLGKLENFDIDSLIQELGLMKNNRDATALKSKLENLQNRKAREKEKEKERSRELERNAFRNEMKDGKEKGDGNFHRINGHNPLRIITDDPLSIENVGNDNHELPMMSAGISRRRHNMDPGNEEAGEKQQKTFPFKPTPPPSPPPSSIAGGVVQTEFHRNHFAPDNKPARMSPRLMVRDYTHVRDWDGMKFEQSSWGEFSGNETDVSGVNGGYPYPPGLRRTSSGISMNGYNSNLEDAANPNFRNPNLLRRNVSNAGSGSGRDRLGRTLSGPSVFSPDQKFTNVNVDGEDLEEAIMVGGGGYRDASLLRPGERYENARGGRMMGRWEDDGEDWGRNEQEMDYYYYRNGNPIPNNGLPDGFYAVSRDEFRRQPSFPSSSTTNRRTSPRGEGKVPPLSRTASTSSAYSNHHFEEGNVNGNKMFRTRQGTRPTPPRLRPAPNMQVRNDKYAMYSDSEHAKYNGVNGMVQKPLPPNGYQNPNLSPFNPNQYPNQISNQNVYANANDGIEPYPNPNAYSRPASPPPFHPQPQPQVRRDVPLQPEANLNISPRSSNPSPRSGVGEEATSAGRERKGPSEEDLALIRADWREDAAKGGCVACGKIDCDDRSCISAHDNNHNDDGEDTDVIIIENESFEKHESNVMPVSFKWKKGELLGEGAYGKVFAGLNQTTGELMAVKQLKILDAEQRSSHMDALEREISLYRTMRHKHIVGYIGMERDVAAGTLYVFLEFVSGGSIHSMLERFGKFSESLVRVYTRQLLLGLEYLHRCKIIHRDIKGGNVLVDRDGMVKLADFGASKAFNDTTFTDGFKSIRGSVFWMAPEVIKGDGYGRRADIWSVGCTVVEMLTANHPWPDIDNTWAAIFHIAKTTTGPPLPEDCSDDAKDFLNSCFHLDAKKRGSASELLKHPFVASVPDNVRDLRIDAMEN